ncbi:hypothetical protein WJX81_002664 [Elliptochloris bilobata]|uniref:Methyltransferase FkbM domain-containing protein n=1 Tax=Elliptochloris bilobata TaxID=381761 RepID=A0AAW1S4I1_9CHLO
MTVHAQNDIVSSYMTDSNFWEKKLAEEMLVRLESARAQALAAGRRTPIFLDIGANVGSYALSAAAHGFRVVAFEPLTINAVALRRSLCRNPTLAPHVTLHEQALAGEARQGCVLVSAAQNVGDGTLKCDMPPGWAPGEGYSVRPGAHDFVRLDDFLCAHDTGDIAFAKLDVEGYEGDVLEGGRDVLLHRKIPYIHTEVGPGMMRSAGGDPTAFLQQFVEAGYEIRLDDWDTSATYTPAMAALIAEQREIVNVCLTYKPGSSGPSVPPICSGPLCSRRLS